MFFMSSALNDYGTGMTPVSSTSVSVTKWVWRRDENGNETNGNVWHESSHLASDSVMLLRLLMLMLKICRLSPAGPLKAGSDT